MLSSSPHCFAKVVVLNWFPQILSGFHLKEHVDSVWIARSGPTFVPVDKFLQKIWSISAHSVFQTDLLHNISMKAGI